MVREKTIPYSLWAWHTHTIVFSKTRNYLSIQVAQKLYWQVGHHTYLTQEIAYDDPADDSGNFNINSYLYLDTILSDHLSWRVGAEFYYNSDPAAGAEKDDTVISCDGTRAKPDFKGGLCEL
ncbi:DUF481 domain-containing protein [Akkermansiaceae bacterium]|nr:DUF481 domain-containing protein [Akkermansiaceae bacterium]